MIRTLLLSLLITIPSWAREYVKVTAFDMKPKDVFGDYTGTQVNLSGLDVSFPEDYTTKKTLATLPLARLSDGLSKRPALRWDVHYGDQLEALQVIDVENYNMSFKSRYLGGKFATLDLNENLDLDGLFHLNQQAKSAWATFENECADGNQRVAIEKYISRKICKGAKKQLIELKSSLASFLLATPMKPYNFFDSLSCSNNPDEEYDEAHCSLVRLASSSLPEWIEVKEKVSRFFSHTEPQFTVQFAGLGFVTEVFTREMSLPRFHPFFIQIVVEALAEGYPFPYAAKTHGIIGHKMMFQHNKINWTIAGGRMNRGGGIQEEFLNMVAVKAFQSDELASADDLLTLAQFNRDDYVKRFKKLYSSLRAEQLLHWISLFDDNIENWGLLPGATEYFLRTLAAVRYSGGEVDNSFLGNVRTHLTLVNLLKTTDEFSHYKTPTIEAGSSNEKALDRLYRVGAWRKLWHME